MGKKLFYNKEARGWEDALPVGNGRIGAMVFGGSLNDRIQINEETLWSGYPYKEDREHSMEEVYKIRKLVKNGKYKEAHDAVSASMLGVESQAYQAYGNIYIDTAWNRSTEVSEYCRELDIENAISRTNFLHDGKWISKEYFVSLADDVLVVNIKSEEPHKYHIYQAIYPESRIITESGITKVIGRCPTGVKLQYEDKESIHFCSMLTVKSEGGSIISGANSVQVFDTTDFTLIFSLKTSFNGYDKLPVSEGRDYEKECKECIGKANKFNYEELKKRHIAEYKKYFDRVELRIDGEDYSDIPTDERIRNVAEGTVDNGLVTLLFDYSRYLAISASGINNQPMNLQGIWNDSMLPPWSSNYTMNINTQMNYWSVETCDLPEFHMPFLRMIKDLSEKGNNFGLRGWSSWHNSDIWRFNYEATKGVKWGYWPMGGFWSARHIWEHYIHTKDIDFLKEYYPVLFRATEFLENWMFEDDEGYLTTCPSTSPENEFLVNGEKCAVCEGSAMDMAIILDIFDKTIKISKILGYDASKLEAILKKLKPVKIGADGRILEWGKEFEENEPWHRHISHLYGFFPADILYEKKYVDAVEESLRVKIESGGGGTGWSNAWIANVYARLKNGEKVMHHIRHMFKKSIYPNMLDAHPPFQIDGNFGIASAICEALMQSHTGKIELLPALPKEWESGAVQGIVTRTGEKIDFEWKNGKVINESYNDLIHNNRR